MKKIVLFIFLFLHFSNLIFCQYQTNLDSTTVVHLEKFIKVWGFLKYYHPKVVQGHYDWDTVFIINVSKIIEAKTKKQFNEIIKKIIDTAGPITYLKNSDTVINKKYFPNTDFTWLSDTASFNNEITNLLRNLKTHFKKKKNYYAKENLEGIIFYNREKSYTETFPDEPKRLLSLARYWNIINYFCPNKDLADKNWNNILASYIPQFINAKNAIEYNLHVLKLTASINDSHAGYPLTFSSVISQDVFNIGFLAPVRVELIENKTTVTEIYSDSLASLYDIKKGDIIEEINGIKTKKIRDSLRHLIGASNEQVKQFFISKQILRYNKSFCEITIKRDSLNKEIKLESIDYDKFIGYYQKKYKNQMILSRIADSIYYVLLQNINFKDVRTIRDSIRKAKTIIIDLRCYPCDYIFPGLRMTKFLYPCKIPYAIEQFTCANLPGYTRKEPIWIAGPTHKRKDYFKGKIIVLIDENTMSMSEVYCLILKAVPGCIIIGSSTAGSPGGVSEKLMLPGGISTIFSESTVFTPDQKKINGIGIIPDVYVVPTIKGITEGKDEILNRAVEYIKIKK